MSEIDFRDRRGTVRYDLCACGSRKQRNRDMCADCRKEQRLAPTKIDPPLNYLAYRPPTGRFHVLAVWGWPNFGYRNCQCRFSIIDCATGEEIERLRAVFETKALETRYELVKRVKKMNRADRQDAA